MILLKLAIEVDFLKLAIEVNFSHFRRDEFLFKKRDTVPALKL